MKLLICGGRTFNAYDQLDLAIRRLNQFPEIIIEGGAPGADRLARQWAKTNGFHFAEVPALWDYFNKGAGPRRNAAMLILKPDFCLAMPGGTGTADMIAKCQAANIPVWRPYG